MRNKIFALTLLILFGIGVSILLMPQQNVSVNEKRELHTTEDIQFTNRLSSTTEAVLKDQFFARDSIVSGYYKMNIKLGNLFNLISRGSVVSDAFGNITINYLSNGVVELDDNYLISEIPGYSQEEIESAESRGYNVTEFAEKYPDVNVYVYFPTRIEEYLNPEHPGELVSRDAYKVQLNPRIRTAALELYSLQDYQKYFFKTEDHWNALGAYQGYKDMINLLSNDYSLEAPRSVINEVVYPYTFKGNISGKIGAYGSEDSIIDLELDGIGKFDFYQNGELTDFYAIKQEYAKNGNTSVYSDYDWYFGDNAFLRVFDFKQEDKPNLLIFADSYINTNMMWIASHFNQTVILDLRSKPADFSMDYYMSEYGIDAVLVMLSYNTMYLNGNMYIPLN